MAIKTDRSVFDFLRNASRDDLMHLITTHGTPSKASTAIGVDAKVFNRYAQKNKIDTRIKNITYDYETYCATQFCMNRPASASGICFSCYAKQSKNK